MLSHRLYYSFLRKLRAGWFQRQFADVDKPKISLEDYKISQLKQPVKIAISPGHGGKDRGCQGPKETTEADVARKISHAMFKFANKKVIDFHIYDYYVSKKNYTRRIYESDINECDYYMPIHLNWSPKPKTNGFFIMVYREEENRLALARRIGNEFLKEFPISFKDYDAVRDGVMLRNKGRGTYELRKPKAVTLYFEIGFLSSPQWEDTLLADGNIEMIAKVLVRSMQGWFLDNLEKIPYQNVLNSSI
jgi:N-acetylmuramoyl-L-alanine amidase